MLLCLNCWRYPVFVCFHSPPNDHIYHVYIYNIYVYIYILDYIIHGPAGPALFLLIRLYQAALAHGVKLNFAVVLRIEVWMWITQSQNQTLKVFVWLESTITSESFPSQGVRLAIEAWHVNFVEDSRPLVMDNHSRINLRYVTAYDTWDMMLSIGHRWRFFSPEILFQPLENLFQSEKPTQN